MRGRVIPLITCIVLLGGLATVALGQVGSPSPARAAAVRVTGAFEISNSIDGQPIFAAKEIGPGGLARGKVTIEDSGSVPVALTLKREELTDLPGVGGGVLSGHLQLTVLEVGGSGSPSTIYTGPLDSMPAQKAGELNPGKSRTYEFIATLPDGAPSAQNSLQSASTSVAYSWVAEEAIGGGEEEGGGETPKTPGGGGAGNGGGTGGGTGGESGVNPGGGVQGAAATLDLTVPRIRGTLTKGGRLIIFINCNASCRISVRGKLRARAHGHHRTAKIRFGVNRPYAAGPQKMRIPIPRGLRKWLRRMPPPKRLGAKLTFTAVGTAGGRDVVKKKVRLTVRHH